VGRIFYIRIALVLATAMSVPSWAGSSRHSFVPADLKGPQKDQCMHYLQLAAESVVAPGREPIRMTIGHLGSLRSVLTRSGASEDAVKHIVGWLDEQLAMHQTHSIWATTVEEIRRQLARPTLFACILKPECDLNTAADAQLKAAQVAMEALDLARFPELSPNPVPLLERRRPSSIGRGGVSSGLHAIFLKLPEIEGQPDWIVRHELGMFLSYFAHEVTHAADSEKFSQWILANYRLIEQKRFDEVDSLFVALTREQPDGKILVDQGFLATYLESRGYSVSDWVQKTHPDIDVDRRYGSGLFTPPNQVAIGAIQDNGGGWFLDRNRIDKDNIFDFGVKLGKRFDKVIRAAGISPP
jgi:hypothetical protein